MYESHDQTMYFEGEIAFFSENDLFDPCDPYVTFDPKLVTSKVRVHRLDIVTKYEHHRT